MSFPVGGKLLAKDRVGVWRRGKVIRDDGDGDERRVFVHFNKFKATQREWIGVKAGKLADLSDESRVLAEAAEETHGTTLGYHPEEDAYEAESIIRLCRGVLDRKTGLWRESKHGATEGAIIRWAGYEESDDSFEPLYNVGAPLIDEYRAAHPLPTAPEARKRKAGREPRPAKAPRPEPQPFVLEACAGLSAEFKAQMAAVAESWLAADLGREIVATVRSTHEACYNKLIVSQSVPPAAYLALHTLLTQWAAEMAGTQVTELKSLKGGRDGKHVVDEFQLVGSAIVSKLAAPYMPEEKGIDWLAVNTKTNSVSAVVPYFHLKLKTERVRAGEPAPSAKLIVHAQVVKLVGDVNNTRKATWKFDDKRGRDPKDKKDVNYTEEWKQSQRINVSRKVQRLAGRDSAGRVPKKLLPFVTAVLARV
jgi:hypothetical protein